MLTPKKSKLSVPTHHTVLTLKHRNTFLIAIASFFTFLFLLSASSSALDIFQPLKAPFDIAFDDKRNSQENNELRTLLIEAIQTHNSKSEKHKNLAQYRVATANKKILEKVMRSQGYYNSDVGFKIMADTSEKQDSRIRYLINKGPLYTINQIRFRFPANVSAPDAETFILKKGDALVADNVLSAQESILNKLRETSCLYEIKLTHQALIREDKQQADLVFKLEDSPKTYFDKVSIEGLETIHKDYIERLVNVKSGDCYRTAYLDQSRLNLLQSNLLASVDYQVTLRDADNLENKIADVIFQVGERHHRSVKAGVNYSTDGGAGLKLGWRHRNLFGRAENFDLDTGFNDINKIVSARLVLPRFLRDKQSLSISTRYEEETPEAFESTKLHSSAIISRRFGAHTTAELGAALTRSRVNEDGMEETFNLISIPVGLTYDYRNSILNATRGWMTNTSLSPFTDIEKENVRFLRWTGTAAVYASALDWSMKPTLAARISVGSISGAGLKDVPADERFYVGGGGSVRGYAYQSLGELSDNKADGGLSFGEVSLEIRTLLYGNWGLALFVDGGYAYPEELPSFGSDFRWGTGFGLRYHTSFAPIRLDLGFPLNRRDEVDDSFQLYISIGQAF